MISAKWSERFVLFMLGMMLGGIIMALIANHAITEITNTQHGCAEVRR